MNFAGRRGAGGSFGGGRKYTRRRTRERGLTVRRANSALKLEIYGRSYREDEGGRRALVNHLQIRSGDEKENKNRASALEFRNDVSLIPGASSRLQIHNTHTHRG